MSRLLMVSPEYPYPQRCGFTVRVGDLCRHLAERAELDLFLCRWLADTENLPGRQIFKQVSAAARREETTELSLARRVVRRLFPPHFDDAVYLPDAVVAQLAGLLARKRYRACILQAPFLARAMPVIPDGTLKIVDAIDLWHQKYLGFKALGCGRLLAHFRDAERELAFYRSADRVLAISRYDHEHLLANEVNSLYTPVAFAPDPLPARNPPGRDLLIASGSGPFNMDAVRFLVRDVLPLVRREIPDVRLKIANPAPEIVRDYAGHRQVVFLPFRDHPRDLYAEVDLAVAPLRHTSGLKIKVLEAFAYGKPILLTPAAAQGIPCGAYAQREVSAEPDKYAGQIVLALRDPGYRHALIESGLALLRREYGSEHAYGPLTEVLA